MDWRKTGLIAIACGIFFAASDLSAGTQEAKAQPQSYENTGVIKAKGTETKVLKVQTQTGMLNFHYKRHGKKQCAGFKELAVGDTVKVTASDNKPVSEATCILKVKAEPEPK
ncbi:MAG TPA: hypothetical protein DCR97_12910 [Deltaproteobacteria bacterium]|nr:hypothetical protein [Deltaproteobacteria bacterium]